MSDSSKDIPFIADLVIEYREACSATPENPPDLRAFLDACGHATLYDRVHEGLNAIGHFDALAQQAASSVPREDDIPIPDRIGSFLIQGQIGRGGMGIVYRVRDAVLRRGLALKILHPRYNVNPLPAPPNATDVTMAYAATIPEAVRRFRGEACIMGQLQHPNIPAVHVLSDHESRPYFVMKLIKGQTLDYLIQHARGKLNLLSLFEGICQGLSYAHDRKVIHRDLKPANIMVGTFGEVQIMD